MTAPAKPGWAAVDPQEAARRCANLSTWAYGAGICTGVLVYHFVAAPALAVDPPRAVSATLMGVGQHLCKDWQGIKNVARVSEKAYTFTCEKYAQFSELEVK